jgi:peptide/nickel transport system substrate-binding protein
MTGRRQGGRRPTRHRRFSRRAMRREAQSEMSEQGKFSNLYEELKAGKVTRRQFIQRATALGVGLPVAMFVLKAVPEAGAAPRPRNVGFGIAAQGAAAERPTSGMEGKKRGEGGELKLLQWQAVTQLSPHVSSGTKDYLGASLVLEPLLSYLPDGTLVPTLATEVPSVENGQLAKDLTSVTFTIRDGVKWSDGEPFTAKDVVFTWNWIMDPKNASVSIGVWQPIKSIEAVDDVTAKVTFTDPAANWFEPFTGTIWGFIYPEHVLSAEGSHDAFVQNPIGTGPYKVDSFSENDQVIYVVNDNYREADKPYFAKVNLKGGGDAASAARAVLQTGEWDYAWNLQVEPAILKQLIEGGGKGEVVAIPGTNVERINLNLSDPNKEVEGQRSYYKEPHPFFSDKAVRTAMTLAADRETISTQFYGEGEPATANILAGLPASESKNTSFEFNVDKAKQTLDDAGWTMNGDVRAKDGVELRLIYSTTINPVRQKTQAVVKKSLEEIGFKVQLQQVDSGIFFDNSAGNEQNISHMYVDTQMYTNGATSTSTVSYMIAWYAGKDGTNIAQKSNAWTGQNNQRYVNPEYDTIFEQLQKETDLEKAAELSIQLNDILIDDAILVPLVNRAADKYAIANTLNKENIALGAFEVNYWNIQNWNRVEG